MEKGLLFRFCFNKLFYDHPKEYPTLIQSITNYQPNILIAPYTFILHLCTILIFYIK
jgi:hypothetical protein